MMTFFYGAFDLQVCGVHNVAGQIRLNQFPFKPE